MILWNSQSIYLMHIYERRPEYQPPSDVRQRSSIGRSLAIQYRLSTSQRTLGSIINEKAVAELTAYSHYLGSIDSLCDRRRSCVIIY